MTMACSTETSKRRTKVYRTAARRCEKEAEWGACIYISFANQNTKNETLLKWTSDPEVIAFRKFFYPDELAGSLWWEDNDPRTLALCFMAAMVEAGDA